MKFGKLGNSIFLVLALALTFGGVCATFLHESVQAAARAQASSIVIEKVANVTTPAPGQRVTFTITVTPPDNTPYWNIPILITEVLPPYVDFVDASAPYTYGMNTLQWAHLLPAAPELAVVTFSVQVTQNVTAYLPIVNQDYAVLARGQVFHGAPVTLTVAAHPGVILQLLQLSPTLLFGSQTQVPYWITNTGNIAADFTLAASLHSDSPLPGWSASPPLPMALDPRRGRLITVTVTAGQNPLRHPVAARLTLTATSPLTSTHNSDVVVTARYAWVYLPLVLRSFPPIPTITAFALIPWRGSQAQHYAYSAEVTATLAAAVQNDVIEQVCFGPTARTLTDCRSFAETVAYTLSPGSGYRSVYAQVKGAHGGVSAPALAAITLLENGDFADGLAQWNVVQAALPAAAPGGRALLGDAALTCHPIPIGDATIAQAVDLRAVPAGKTITLYFDYEIVTEDKFANSDFDRFVVLINGQEKRRDGYRGSETIGCGKWHTITQTDFALDLTAYGGQSISLLLGNYTRYDEWYNTYTYVDNVRVVVIP